MKQTQKTNKKQSDSHRHRGWRCLFTAVSVLLIALTLSANVAVLLLASYVSNNPKRFRIDPTLFLPSEASAPSTLYYFPQSSEKNEEFPALNSAEVLEGEALQNGERSSYVPIEEIPDTLKDAFVAIEDKRFYTHRGVDFRRTGAAILNYVLKGGRRFGGSTITQQLVKNITGDNERTPLRKLSELFRAADLERTLTKEEILEGYLNVIPLGSGCRGVGAAAERYFGKPPKELTLAESASIAAITQNPTRYDPSRHPEENRKRRDTVLSEMRNQGYISETDYQNALSEALSVVESTASAEIGVQSWYADLVISDVIRDLTATYGYTRAEASHLIYYGDLKIYTLIDPELQRVLTAYYEDSSHFPRLENGKTPQSAMILLDPQTGNVLAVAGAIGEKEGNRLYSFATDAKRPPGSVLKPISVYAPALEYGIAGYATVYDDVPVRFDKNVAWPKNANGVYRGLSSVDIAMRNSLNTVAVRVLEEVGVSRAFHFARDTLGITSLSDGADGKASDLGLASLALGQMSYGATLREITAAYTAFANEGIYRNARSYAVVTRNDGTVLLDNKAVLRPALSEGNAELMPKMLENVTKNGTARALTLTEEVDVAGKTGTTQNSFDRWFVGYTNGLLAGVWYGCEYPESLESVKGNPSLTVWDAVMRQCYSRVLKPRGEVKEHFSYPRLRAVRVCADSGLLISDACTLDPRGDRSTVAYFTEGTVPTEFCHCHTEVFYCGSGTEEADGVCTEPDSPSTLRRVALIRVKRSFPIDVFVTDAQYTASPYGSPVGTDPPAASLPYYAGLLEDGRYCGKSYTRLPFNRACRKKKPEPAAR